MENNILVKIRNLIEGFVKFPSLKEGETAIQVGFDLSSKNLVTDVVVMLHRVGKKGLVLAIDPDVTNHEKLKKITDNSSHNIRYVQKATYSYNTKEKLELAVRASQNKLNIVQGEIDEDKKTQKFIQVDLASLDSIVEDENIDIQTIGVVHITNNGAEYNTLQGMNKILTEAKNICILVRCGRAGDIGIIDGTPDNKLIETHLKKYGFETKFYRITDLKYWWLSKLILKREWWFGKEELPQGVVIATKGNKKMRFLQSYA